MKMIVLLYARCSISHRPNTVLVATKIYSIAVDFMIGRNDSLV
jgi:hypothetical protein